MRAETRNQILKITIATRLDRIIGFLGRHRWFVSLVQRLAPPPSMYRPSDHRKVMLLGVQFEVQMNDLMSQPIYFGLHLDEIFCLQNVIHKNDVVIDVGANIGRWSLFVAHLYKTQMIYAFEPFQETFMKLQKNISLNQQFKIQTVNQAVSDSEGKIAMSVRDCFNTGMNQINLASPDKNLSAVRLDFFCEINNIQKIDVIKIDVEGFEMNVLKGSENLIKQWHPKIICEIDDFLLSQNKTTPTNIFNFLQGLNYQIYQLPEMSPVTANTPIQDIHFDIVALPMKENCL